MMSLSEIINPFPTTPATTLWEYVKADHQRHADQIALTARHQTANHLSHLHGERHDSANLHYLSWTHSQVRAAGLAVASSLYHQGVARGSTVVTVLPNGVECLIVLWAVIAMQLTIAPLDPETTSSGRSTELLDFLKRLQPATVIVSDRAGVEAVSLALNELDHTLQGGLVVEDVHVPGWVSLHSISHSQDTLNAAAWQQDLDIEAKGSRVSHILFTSGTSGGEPKGCPLTVNNLLAARAQNRHVPSGSVNVITFVNFRAIFTHFALSCIHAGFELFLPSPILDTTLALDSLEMLSMAGRNPSYMAVPTFIQLLATDESLVGRNLDGVTYIRLGGDLVTEDMVAKTKRIFPKAIVLCGMGMTEGVGVTGIKSCAEVPRLRGIYAVGQALPTSSVRLVDPSDDRTVVRRGEVGEYHVHAPGVITEYLGGAQPEAFYDDEHGRWLRTGDHGIMDEAGWVYILGRNKDVIKKAGLKISPAVIEAVLNRQPGITAQVIGVADPIHGQVPVAVVKDRGDYDVDSVKQIVRIGMNKDYALGDVVFLDELGLQDFPLNSTGKVMKARLAELVSELRGKRR